MLYLLMYSSQQTRKHSRTKACVSTTDASPPPFIMRGHEQVRRKRGQTVD